ncbi:hypothetical protein I5S86_19415 [Priestia aryabhattai]|nr:hypothetical protein I5S86_19415 [Priestia aryabhattai]
MRYRWMDIDWPCSIDQLATRLKTMSFSDSQQHGFIIDKIRSGELSARYIEKIIYTDTVTDPFGNETVFDRTEYREYAFTVSNESPTLELINPPRSVQALLNRFSEITNFRITIEPLKIDVASWATETLATKSLSGNLDMIQISKLELKNKAFAKVLISGDTEIQDACSDLIGDRKYAVEKVRIRLNDQHSGTIVLSNTGAATISLNEVDESLSKLLRECLIRTLAKSSL